MKQISTSHSDWFRSVAEEALSAKLVDTLPPLSIQQGVADLLDALALMEGFGQPEPDRAPIIYSDIRI